MKQTEVRNNALVGKEDLCQEIARLQAEVNELAVKVSACQGNDLHYIWSNLANARAYLATALEASRQLKSHPVISDWQI